MKRSCSNVIESFFLGGGGSLLLASKVKKIRGQEQTRRSEMNGCQANKDKVPAIHISDLPIALTQNAAPSSSGQREQ